ncbi:MAG: hypothetical protein ACYTJ0_00440 [Planctomycetota bacterium]|jgi:hypothetical protein
MTGNETDRAKLLASTANRLRLIQLDFAEEAADVRQQYLADEVDRVLATLAVDERDAFVAELRERFPSWDRQVELKPAPREDAVRSAGDQRELSDASFLVSRLVDLAPTLSDDERRVIRDRLAAADLGGSSAPLSADEQAIATLQTRLGLTEATLDQDRVLATTDLLLDFLFKMDRVAWQVWREIAPRSKKRGATNLKDTVGRFATGDTAVGQEQIAGHVEVLRQLVAALIYAVRRAAGDFSRKYSGRYSVAAIEEFVRTEGKGGFLQSPEARYWKKYCELAEELDPKLIERDILQAIAEYATRMMEGAG